MSMRDYAEERYGVIFTEEMLQKIVKEQEPEYEDDLWDLAEHIGLETISSFSGEAYLVDDKGENAWTTDVLSFCSDHIFLAELRKWSSLFRAGYSSMDEVVAELKGDYGKYLPVDFDYARNVRHIVGTTIG